MALLLRFGGSDDPRARYLGWSPRQVTLRLSEATGTAVPAVVRNRDAEGGRLLFCAPTNMDWGPEIRVDVPGDGSPTTVDVVGHYPFASRRDGDAVIEAVADAGSIAAATMPTMIRVRKDANALSDGERDLFVATLAAFNDAGAGRFQEFREIHDEAGNAEMHSLPGFLAWHRAFLLDFERELQAIEPAVALPYWRFDRPAEYLFSPAFLGAEDGSGRVVLAASNPLAGWVTDQRPGISRQVVNDNGPALEGPIDPAEMATVEGAIQFQELWPGLNEIHASAHRAFMGYIEFLHSAVRDPLFFLVHAAVDHAWARWQSSSQTRDPAAVGAYVGGMLRIGHNLPDEMWPWNQVTSDPRPSHAPGGMFCYSPTATAPGAKPRVEQMFDYQGVAHPGNRLGFDYDDVPFPGFEPT